MVRFKHEIAKRSVLADGNTAIQFTGENSVFCPNEFPPICILDTLKKTGLKITYTIVGCSRMGWTFKTLDDY